MKHSPGTLRVLVFCKATGAESLGHDGRRCFEFLRSQKTHRFWRCFWWNPKPFWKKISLVHLESLFQKQSTSRWRCLLQNLSKTSRLFWCPPPPRPPERGGPWRKKKMEDFVEDQPCWATKGPPFLFLIQRYSKTFEKYTRKEHLNKLFPQKTWMITWGYQQNSSMNVVFSGVHEAITCDQTKNTKKIDWTNERSCFAKAGRRLFFRANRGLLLHLTTNDVTMTHPKSWKHKVTHTHILNTHHPKARTNNILGNHHRRKQTTILNIL